MKTKNAIDLINEIISKGDIMRDNIRNAENILVKLLNDETIKNKGLSIISSEMFIEFSCEVEIRESDIPQNEIEIIFAVKRLFPSFSESENGMGFIINYNDLRL